MSQHDTHTYESSDGQFLAAANACVLNGILNAPPPAMTVAAPPPRRARANNPPPGIRVVAD